VKTIRTLLFLCAAAMATHAACAQGSVYVAPMYDSFGFNGTGYPSGGSFKSATGGVMGGGFYTFPSGSRFKAGIDGRAAYSSGYKGGQAYTGALRVSFVPHHNRLRPYFQLGGGVVSTQLNSTVCSFSCATTTSRITSGVAQLAFGLDIRLTNHFDLRAFDYGADAGGGNSGTHAAMGFLDVGVVYHFHGTNGL
jgi:hypothetical protein